MTQNKTSALVRKCMQFVSISILLGCGDGLNAPTFEDGAVQIAEPFCAALLKHGARTEPVESCVANELDHLCADRWDCERVLTHEEQAAFNLCADELAVWDCRWFLPASCYAVLELR